MTVQVPPARGVIREGALAVGGLVLLVGVVLHGGVSDASALAVALVLLGAGPGAIAVQSLGGAHPAPDPEPPNGKVDDQGEPLEDWPDGPREVK